MTAGRTFAMAGLALAIAGAFGAAIIRYLAPIPMVGAFGFGETAMVGYLIAGICWASIGALLVIRRPTNRVGWLMVVVGVGYALSQATVATTFAFAAEGTARGVQLAQFAGWTTVLLQLVTILQFAIGFIFPTGRAQSRGWARFMRGFWAFALVFSVVSLSQPGPLQLIPGVRNPFGIGPDLRGDQLIAPIFVLLTMIVLVGLVISMAARYRAADRVERQQLKWFVVASGMSAAGLGIAQLELTDAIGLTIYVFVGATVPVAIGIAILRYRLYEIDRIISRSLAYAAVTGILALTFGATILVLQAVLARFTEGQSIAVVASTLAVFTLFQPVLRRVRRTVDRRFDRTRYDAENTAAAFSDRLRNEVDLATVTTDLMRTTGSALSPATLGVWLRGGSR